MSAALVFGAPGAPCAAVNFTADGYQAADGAITVHAGGDFVDPYFATKALLVADAAGLDIAAAANRWIAWLLPRQRADGRFARYCRADRQWRSCADADADDALSALWSELLYRVAANAEMPAAWSASAKRTESHLAELYQTGSGLYQVALEQPLIYFIDNVEIYGAYTRTAKRRRLTAPLAALRTGWQARRLRRDVTRAFWQPGEQTFRVVLNGGEKPAFYPHAVAQLYPLLEDMTTPAGTPADVFAAWFRRYGERWLAFTEDPYPWGLVALAAYRAGAHHAAMRWVARATPLRYGSRWNVLEEAVYQALLHCAGDARITGCRQVES